MITVVRTDAQYDVPAELLWQHVVRYDTLETVMSGALVSVKCPSGEEQVGHDVQLTFKFLSIVPIGRWRFKVTARDDTRRLLISLESGTGVRRWSHQIVIDEDGRDRCRLSDTIEIDAGVLTPLVARFARAEYQRRHTLRKAMLARTIQ